MKLQYREDLLCSKHFSVPCFQYTRMVAESPTPEECARRWGLIVIGARKVGAPEVGCFVFLVGVLLILHPH